MRKYRFLRLLLSSWVAILSILVLTFVASQGVAQQARVLPYNGASSQEQGPQGSVRYQRQFYLITPEEMSTSDLSIGSDIQSIGFAIGLSQDITTTGRFKVYLQNTSDTLSRVDTSWTYVTVLDNYFHPTNLFPGNYEWQVRSQCSDSSDFSTVSNFTNEELSTCYKPDSLFANSITDTTATLNWNTLGVQDSFLVEYRQAGASSWVNAIASGKTFDLIGLVENENYLWRVTSYCSGAESGSSSSSLLTDYVTGCTAPTTLSVGALGNTTATLSWASDPDYTRFDVRFRREGTSFWIKAISFTDSVNLNFGLVEGTNYEWQVRTVCDTNQSFGAFVPGPPFLTTGTPVCYAPTGMKASSITDTSALMSWSSVPGATEYVVRMRALRTISWANAIAPMIEVHDDSIVIPSVVGVFFTPFIGDSSFTYNGAGVYVAWEYSNDSSSLSSPNTSLSHEQNASVKSFSSKISMNDTVAGEILSYTNLRPETWIGSTNLRDSVSVESVYTMGSLAIPYGQPVEIQARIRNYSSQMKTLPVTLTIKDQKSGQIRFNHTQMVDIGGFSDTVTIFPDWAAQQIETDSVIVSVPGQASENVLNNNRNYYIQDVNSHSLSYADESSPLIGAEVGFGSGEGLILNRHFMHDCGKVIGVNVYLDYSAIGQTVFGVALDSSGAIVSQTENLMVESTDVNKTYAFYFSTPPQFTNETYYVGLGQIASMESYDPVGAQWEGDPVRPNAYYHANLDGSGLSDTLAIARPMIYAEVAESIPLPFIYGDEILCEGSTGVLHTGSLEMRYANKVIDVSSEFGGQDFGARKTLGIENVFPEHGLNSEAWMSASADGQREYLVLSFPDTLPINNIRIFESFNPGAIDTVYVKNAGSGNYEVVYTDSAVSLGGGSRVLSIEFAMTSFDVYEVKIAMNSPAVSGFNAIDAVAIGQRFETASYDSYLWSPGAITTDSITITQDGNYDLTVSLGGCSVSTSLQVVTPDSIVPTITATGPTTFCIGGSVVLKASETGGNTWSTGETTDSIVVSEMGAYYVTRDDGCNLITSNTINVTVNTAPSVSIAGGTICQGDAAVLDAGPGFDQYLWSTGDTSQTISTTLAGLYRVTVTDSNGCIGSAFAITSVQIPPDPKVVGVLGYCPGDSTVLDAGGGYAQYNWSTGDTSQSINVNTSGSFDVVVADADGCTGADSVVVAEFVPPAPFISGSLGICIGASTQLDAGGGYASYLWSTGDTSQTILIDTAATFSVLVTDDNGCIGSASATTTTDGAIPVPPGPITGPQDGLCNETGVVYSIDPVPNATFYVWTVPAGVTIVSGQGSTSITVDMDSTFAGGDIVVAASNACGQSPSIDPTLITIQGFPNTPDPVSGATQVTCDYANIQYSIPAVGDANSYTWTVPEGALITSGQGTVTIQVTFAGNSGDVCVTADNDCGSSSPACILVNISDANNLLVTNNADSGAGSLRQMILDACWGDTIRFAASLIGDTIKLTGAEIVIDKHLNIFGSGMDALHVSGSNISRIFNIDSGIQMHLKDVTLIDGYSVLNGGAFYNQGITSLTNVRLKNNFQGNDSRAFTSDNKVIIRKGLVESLQ